MVSFKGQDIVTVREVPGRWRICGYGKRPYADARTGLMLITPDDEDAFLYVITYIHETSNVMMRHPEDLSHVARDGALF